MAAATARVLAGARSLTAITEWIRYAPVWPAGLLRLPRQLVDQHGVRFAPPHLAPSPRPTRRRRPGPGNRSLHHRPHHPHVRRTADDHRRRQGSARFTHRHHHTRHTSGRGGPHRPRPRPAAGHRTRATRSPPSSPCWTPST
ncbi:hypothetical protein [Streptomyces sp. SHP 1-2]|uniref:hypothetical protein n=1 Tax=Streptomyces sp. SHP 1-2 TaxID=2769489 RepID=UPI002238D838|nr:hypothetical protein [Streptomyces sp. SHP 1-2]